MHLRIFALHCVVYVFLARERGEEGEWDEWEGGGRTKKLDEFDKIESFSGENNFTLHSLL
jgi:hypothetical protein